MRAVISSFSFFRGISATAKMPSARLPKANFLNTASETARISTPHVSKVFSNDSASSSTSSDRQTKASISLIPADAARDNSRTPSIIIRPWRCRCLALRKWIASLTRGFWRLVIIDMAFATCTHSSGPPLPTIYPRAAHRTTAPLGKSRPAAECIINVLASIVPFWVHGMVSFSISASRSHS